MEDKFLKIYTRKRRILDEIKNTNINFYNKESNISENMLDDYYKNNEISIKNNNINLYNSKISSLLKELRNVNELLNSLK